MSLLSTTYGNDREFDDIVWGELHSDGALIIQVGNDISIICSVVKCSTVANITMALEYKLQRYADILYSMKCTRMLYEINGQSVFIDIQLPHNVKNFRMVIKLT